MDMAADHPVDASRAGGLRHDLLEAGDEGDGVLHPRLGVLAERPIRQAKAAAAAVQQPVRRHQQRVGAVPNMREPAVREGDRVELVAVEHQQAAPVRRFVHGVAADRDAAEIEPAELAEHLVVVAGDEDHPRAAAGTLQQPPDDVVVRRRPEEAPPQSPPVDDVADQIHRVAVDMVEEVDQHLRVAAAGAEMDVADPDRAVAGPLDDPFGQMRARIGEIGEVGDVCHGDRGKRHWCERWLHRHGGALPAGCR